MEKQNLNAATDFINNFRKNNEKIILAAFSDKKSAIGENGAKMGYHGWHTTMPIDKAWKSIVSANNQGCGVFFTVNHLDPKLDSNRNKKRTKEMVVECRAIWCEDDNVSETGPRYDWPLEPSIVVESSKGKYHYYWLTKTDNIAEWESVMIRMVTEFGSDPNARDLCRVLRLPGSFHMKRAEPWMVKVVDGKEEVYEWKDIVDKFGTASESELDKFLKLQRKSKEAKEKASASGEATGEGIEELYDEKGNRDYEAEIENGINYHGAFIGLSLKHVNNGIRDAKVIRSLMEVCYLKGSMNPEVSAERKERLEIEWSDVDRTIQTAIDKKEHEEEADSVEIKDIVDHSRDSLELHKKSELDWPPGLMGELAKSAYNAQHYQNKDFAIVSAFGTVSGMIGRTFNVKGMGLNLYFAVLAETGMGKDSIDKFITTVYNNLNLFGGSAIDFKGAKRYTGIKALVKSMINKNKMSMVSVHTEAGLMFQSQAGDQAGLLRGMLGMYSRSGANDEFDPDEYSDEENRLPKMFAPAPTFINEATPDTLLSELLKRGSDRIGELPRMYIRRIMGSKPYENLDAHFKMGDDLTSRLNELATRCLENNGNEKPKDVENVEYNKDDYLKFSRYCTDTENALRDDDPLQSVMHSRAAVKVIRMAAVMAVLDGFSSIQKVHWDYACHMHHQEMKGLSFLFKGTGSSDTGEELDEATMVVVKAIHKILTGSYKDKNKTVPSGLWKGRGKTIAFTEHNMFHAVKNNRVLNEMNDSKMHPRPRKGYQKVISMMLDDGTLRRGNVQERSSCRSKNVYAITHEYIYRYAKEEVLGESTKKKS